LKTAASEFHGRVSPDGRWFAYTSNESGRQEVYVAPFPDGGGKTLISTAGGNQPRWRRDGAELFYMSLDAKIMSASVNGRGTGFSVGEVRTLFDVRLRAGQRSQLDVAPDGQRFLVIISTDQRQAAPPITIITNWIAGLPPAK
jgi:Tol biopolymer transport system component